ncbi:MAG TPA: 16S rRNA (adenine(1518)-N(6)/adenine(1519)-N(6))-dimethyltransferase RsmA [Desulfobacteria bacterium]|nr:16S rRNA (adenine(1518)-N(6)/adenine(1519)-N(6))-dimethyltransferase RsmA [Desulfobacteria bacterium]
MTKVETSLTYTKRVLQKYSLRAKKSLGQNFLVDDAVIAAIIHSSGLAPGESVLEIGPGTGVLTRALKDIAARVYAIELDRTLSAMLQEEFQAFNQVQVINADALTFSLAQLESCEGPDKPRLVANLPYYITSPLINHFLVQRQYIKSMTVMVQKEVADRLAAQPGGKDYGVLSIAVQVYCHPQVAFTVPPTAFLPAPKVESAVVNMEMLEKPRIDEGTDRGFFRVVKAAFGQRRKTVANSLAQGLNLNKTEICTVLEGLEISPRERAENLSIAQFNQLTRAILQLK